MALIEIHNLGKQYDEQHALKNVNLKIGKGEVFTLIGPTGAGKTTLLRLLGLLETPDSGEMYFDGVDVIISKRRHLEMRRRMSFVQQKPAVFSMNVYDNVACGLRWRKKDSAVVQQKVNEALELVGLADYKSRNAKTLSGGETQRVAIARALAIEPEVLLLDEPTANLDPVSTVKIEDVLTQIIEQRRITLIMATHDMLQGQRLADRIGVLMDGEILEVGEPRKIFSAPKRKRVAEFLGIENILPGVITDKDDTLVTITIDADGSIIQAISEQEIGEKVYAIMRPEDVTLSLAGDHSSARNVFTGEIIKITGAGPLVRVKINCGFPLISLVTRMSAIELGFAVGMKVYARFKATAIRTIKRLH